MDAKTTANLTLTVRPELSTYWNTQVVKWAPEAEPTTEECLILGLGPDHLGEPERLKFFRSIRIYGEGEVPTILVYVDGKKVAEGAMDIDPNARHTQIFWLPRGTKGYRIMAILVIQGQFQSCEVEADMATGEAE